EKREERALELARLPSQLGAREHAALEAARTFARKRGEVGGIGVRYVEPRAGFGRVGPVNGSNRTARGRGARRRLWGVGGGDGIRGLGLGGPRRGRTLARSGERAEGGAHTMGGPS